MHRLLIVNAGSTSLKLSLLEADDTRSLEADVERRGDGVDEAGLADAVARAGVVDAVVHRVVHGGERYVAPVRIDAGVVAELDSLRELAPLHQPPSLAGIAAMTRALPNVPAYACFDTAFFHDLPEAARTYAVPREWSNAHPLRRYGFHGLSHAYAARHAHEMLGATDLRVVTCHLGGGASLAAVHGAHAVDTTMGFTPLEGLMMATRSGDVDPGLILWMQSHGGLSAADVESALSHRSGLLAIAGSGDMREVVRAADRGDHDATLAREMYVHRLCRAAGAMAASLRGIDALVFTGGVGENDADLRRRAAEALAHLGAEIDSARNGRVAGDTDVSAAGARCHVLVIAAREDLEMARQVRALAV